MRALYIAMQPEAKGLIAALAASPIEKQPAIGYFYECPKRDLILAVSGKDAEMKVDCIGTEPAAIIAHDLITRFKVTSILNVGTCGAHSSLKTKIAEPFLISPRISNHDHRIPLPLFEEYGRGNHPTHPITQEIAKELALDTAPLSSGNSLDHVERDLEIFLHSGAKLKDMEASALAWVCRQHDIPLVCLKVVTDIFDLPHPATDQFASNLEQASRQVTLVAQRILASTSWKDFTP